MKPLFNGRLLAFPANVGLGRKSMAIANTLAYYNTVTITAVKSFIVQAPEVPGAELTTFHFLCKL